jgi:hypothetical protein
MEYAEITKEAFDKLVPPYYSIVHEVENLEHAIKYHYVNHGVKLMAIENFLSVVTQYYIQDINA